jgi:hypothetical protein
MTRALFGELLFFLLPFAAYAIYLLIRERNPARWDNWSAHVSWLAIAGFGCVIAALLVTGVLVKRETRVWVPSHVEDGRLVPGHYQ